MRVIGYSQRQKEWLPVEIEVSFVPGLPQIHLIGQADAVLKESLIKIKSVLRLLEIDLPKSRQIVVNLRGGDFKKKSLDLELPILIAILTELGVIDFLSCDELCAHGELSLEGKIFSSDLLLIKKSVGHRRLLTGFHPDGLLNENHAQFLNVKDLVLTYSINEPDCGKAKKQSRKNTNVRVSGDELSPTYNVFSNRTLLPEFEKDPAQVLFTDQERELLKIVSLGRHSLLLMGPRGLGKSTLAESLNYLAEPPDEETFLHQMKYFFVEDGRYWRPFVHPHHSISHLALIGGGSQCLPGEITRAHGGILLMDEFLEFDPKCQEALREPMQNKTIHLARGQKYQKYECDFHLIATTNLCPCGQWLPGKSVDCAYSQSRCSKYRDKLSGPVIDRFHILSFMRSSGKKEKRHTLASIALEIAAIRNDFKFRRQELIFNTADISHSLKQRLDSELGSLRRLNASIEVAKTLCAIQDTSKITDQILNKALEYTWRPFLDLKTCG
tara:strand:- start:5278 stop:6771 length:1494 start_codon:yes stop_codon:yes gene_type:complete